MQPDDPIPVKELQREITRQLSIKMENAVSCERLQQILSKYIRELIDKDFQQLVFLLYRIDVPEQKLTDTLNKNREEDSAILIARLIIERLLQKIKTRQKSSQKDNNLSEEEKW